METELSMFSKIAMYVFITLDRCALNIHRHPHVLSLFGIIEDADRPAIVFHGGARSRRSS